MLGALFGVALVSTGALGFIVGRSGLWKTSSRWGRWLAVPSAGSPLSNAPMAVPVERTVKLKR
jgi:hypothetical protein